ncbi:MAG: DRTGG domain-containing protein [Syntrophaceae bacterium]|nr:DRTGG domain-containing protein [Syntrophaceae bacterium]
MKLNEIVELLNLEVKTCQSGLDREVKGGYASDLLSDVIANAKEGDIWITLQIHQNIVAVAFLNNLAGIIIVGGRNPDAETLSKAEEQGVVVLASEMSTYDLVGQLYSMGVKRSE